MPRPCSICRHADREAIDQALVAGGVFRNIAERFGTSTTALHRHKQEHIPVYLSQASEAQEITQADSLLTKVQQLEADAKRIQAKAETEGDLRTALQGIRELIRLIELLARVQGELRDDCGANRVPLG